MTTARLRKKKHTHSQAKYCKSQNKKIVGQKRTLNSGRPSKKQDLQECHISTNLALAKEYLTRPIDSLRNLFK